MENPNYLLSEKGTTENNILPFNSQLFAQHVQNHIDYHYNYDVRKAAKKLKVPYLELTKILAAETKGVDINTFIKLQFAINLKAFSINSIYINIPHNEQEKRRAICLPL